MAKDSQHAYNFRHNGLLGSCAHIKGWMTPLDAPSITKKARYHLDQMYIHLEAFRAEVYARRVEPNGTIKEITRAKLSDSSDLE